MFPSSLFCSVGLPLCQLAVLIRFSVIPDIWEGEFPCFILFGLLIFRENTQSFYKSVD